MSNLPYNGDIQEAIRRQDRDAVKRIMSARDSSRPQSADTTDKMKEIFLSLGYIENSVSKAFADAPGNSSSGVKRLLNSDVSFPLPPPKRKSANTKTEEHRVTPQLIDRLDSLSMWTLLQACTDHPNTPQIVIYDAVSRVQMLSQSGRLSVPCISWMQELLKTGYVDELLHILNALGDADSVFGNEALLKLTRANSAPVTEADPSQCADSQAPTQSQTQREARDDPFSAGSVGDRLLQSYQCPITREILVEPVTLQCGHNYSRLALDSLLSLGNRRCPVCKGSIPTGDLAVNMVLRDTIELLYPHVLRRRAIDDIQAARKIGIKELRSVMRWLMNFSHASEVVECALQLIKEWVVADKANAEKVVRDGFVTALCKTLDTMGPGCSSHLDVVEVLAVLADCPTATPSMVSSSVHLELVRTLTSSLRTAVACCAPSAALLLTLVGGMSDEQISLFVADSRRGLPVLLMCAVECIAEQDGGLVSSPGDGDSLRQSVARLGLDIAAVLTTRLCGLEAGTDPSQRHAFVAALLTGGLLDFIASVLAWIQVCDARSPSLVLVLIPDVMVLLAQLGAGGGSAERALLRARCMTDCISLLRPVLGDDDCEAGAVMATSCAWDVIPPVCAAVAGMLRGRDDESLFTASSYDKEALVVAKQLGHAVLEYLSDQLLQSAVAVASRAQPPTVEWRSHRGLRLLSTTASPNLLLRFSTSAYMSCTVPHAPRLPGPLPDTSAEVMNPPPVTSLCLTWNPKQLALSSMTCQLLVFQSVNAHALKVALERGLSVETAVTLVKIPYVSVDLASGGIRHTNLPFQGSLGLADAFGRADQLTVAGRPPMRVQMGHTSPLTIVMNHQSSAVSFNMDGFYTRPFFFPEAKLDNVTTFPTSDEGKKDDHRAQLNTSEYTLSDILSMDEEELELGSASTESFETKTSDRRYGPSRAAPAPAAKTVDVQQRRVSGAFTLLLVSSEKPGDCTTSRSSPSSPTPSSPQALSAPSDQPHDAESKAAAPKVVEKALTMSLSCPSSSAPTRVLSSDPASSQIMRVVDGIWASWDGIGVRVSEDGSRASSSAQVKRNQMAMAEGVSSGVHVFQFSVTACSRGTDLSVGISTADLSSENAFYDNFSMPLFAVRYESSGQISCMTPAGYHPCIPIIAAPCLVSRDVVVFELSMEGQGSVHIFHCGLLVCILDQLFQSLITGSALHPFVTFSAPRQSVHLERLASASSAASDALWVSRSFSSMCALLLAEEGMQQAADSTDCMNGSSSLPPSRLAASPWATIISMSDRLARSIGNGMSTTQQVADLSQLLGVSKSLLGESAGGSARGVVFGGSPHDINTISVKVLSAAASCDDSLVAGLVAAVCATLVTLPYLGSYFCQSLINCGAPGVFAQLIEQFQGHGGGAWAELLDKVLVFTSASAQICDNKGNSFELVRQGLARALLAYGVSADADEAYRDRLFRLLVGVIHRERGHLLKKSATVPHSNPNHPLKSTLLRDVVEAGWHLLLKGKVLSCAEGDHGRDTNTLDKDTIKAMLADLVLSGAHASTCSARYSACFCSRAQSVMHLWNRMSQSPSVPAETFDLDLELAEIEEVPIELRTSSGASYQQLSADNTSDFWASVGSQAHWIDVIPPADADWCEVAVLTTSAVGPESLVVKVGQSSELTTVKTLSLPREEGWHTILRVEEVPAGVYTRTVRLFLRGTENRDTQTSATGTSTKLMGVTVFARSHGWKEGVSRKIFTEYRSRHGYIPDNWRECLFLSILEGNVEVFTRLLNLFGSTCLDQELFFGDGPWSWGHPAHDGKLGFLLPCTSTSAIKRMRTHGLSTDHMEFLISTSSSKSPSEKGFGDKGAKDYVGDGSGDEILSHWCPSPSLSSTTRMRRAQAMTEARESPRNRPRSEGLGTSNSNVQSQTPSPSTAPMTSTPPSTLRTMTSAAQVSTLDTHALGAHFLREYRERLVREATANAMTLAASGMASAGESPIFGIDIGMMRILEDLRAREMSTFQTDILSAVLSNSDQNSVTSPGRPAVQRPVLQSPSTGLGGRASVRSDFHVVNAATFPVSGPVSFLYRLADGSNAEFDASVETCSPHGLFHGQRVRSRAFPEIGYGTVVGVNLGYLWIHFEGDEGATFRKDQWRFAELTLLNCSVGRRVSSSSSSQTTALVTGDRVSRGRHWQWSSQDVFPGNHGTVVETSGNDNWVSVQWDGGGRNTYRYGAEGMFDLEMVVDDVTGHHQMANTKNKRMRSKRLGNEKLGDHEILRLHLRDADCGPILRDTFREAVSVKVDVELLSLHVSSMLALAEYDGEAVSSLHLTDDDLSMLFEIVLDETSPSSLRVNAVNLVTMAATHLAWEGTKDGYWQWLRLPQLIAQLSALPACHELILSSLQLLATVLCRGGGVEPETPSPARRGNTGESQPMSIALLQSVAGGATSATDESDSWDRSAHWDSKEPEVALRRPQSTFPLYSSLMPQPAPRALSSPHADWRNRHDMATARLLSQTRAQRSVAMGLFTPLRGSSSSLALSPLDPGLIPHLSGTPVFAGSRSYVPGVRLQHSRPSPAPMQIRDEGDLEGDRDPADEIFVYERMERSLGMTMLHTAETASMSAPDLTCLHDDTLSDLVSVLLPIVSEQYCQSSPAILTAVDLLSAVVRFPGACTIFTEQSAHLLLLETIRALQGMQANHVSGTILSRCTECLLSLHRLCEEVVPELLNGLLDSASTARDFGTIVSVMKAHHKGGQESMDTQVRCLELLMGRCRVKRRLDKVGIVDWRSRIVSFDKLDARDRNGNWYEAQVRGVRTREEVEVLVHYQGWGSKYDEWIVRSSERLQPLHSETTNWRDDIRLDDPIEVLCLHQEHQDVKRRWFRGVVNRVDGDRVLVVYDKRGLREERWLDLFGEEICYAGTHVPSSGGQLDGLQSQRKNDIMALGAPYYAVRLMRNFASDEVAVGVALDLLRYVLSGEDREMRLDMVNEVHYEKIIFSVMMRHVDSVEVVESGCAVLDILSSILDSEHLSVGDEVESQWRRRGNTAYPGRIVRVRDDGSFDILYDDGDREERVPRERVCLRVTDSRRQQQRSRGAFVCSLMGCGAVDSLLSVMTRYRDQRAVIAPALSVLVVLLDSIGDFQQDVFSRFITANGHVEAVRLLLRSLQTKSSAWPLQRCLRVLLSVASCDGTFKENLFAAGAHAVAISCLQTFPSQTRVLVSSLRLLSAMIARDSALQLPLCRFSTDDEERCLDPRSVDPATGAPHCWDAEEVGEAASVGEGPWLEISLPRLESWRHVCLHLSDFGAASPVSLVLRYESCCERAVGTVKVLPDLPRTGGWTSVLTSDEVQEWVDSEGFLQVGRTSDEATLRLEFTGSSGEGSASSLCVGGVGLVRLVATPLTDTRDASYKDAIAALDGVSLAVECTQLFQGDQELEQSCRSFLKNFATDDDRRELVRNCGGAYFLNSL